MAISIFKVMGNRPREYRRENSRHKFPTEKSAIRKGIQFDSLSSFAAYLELLVNCWSSLRISSVSFLLFFFFASSQTDRFPERNSEFPYKMPRICTYFGQLPYLFSHVSIIDTSSTNKIRWETKHFQFCWWILPHRLRRSHSSKRYPNEDGSSPSLYFPRF